LFLHDEADPNVPAQHSEQLHAAALGQGTLELFDGETHDSLVRDERGPARQRATAWFKRRLVDGTLRALGPR